MLLFALTFLVNFFIVEYMLYFVYAFYHYKIPYIPELLLLLKVQPSIEYQLAIVGFILLFITTLISMIKPLHRIQLFFMGAHSLTPEEKQLLAPALTILEKNKI